MTKEKNIPYVDYSKKATPFIQFVKLNEAPYLVLHQNTFKVLDANEKALQFFKISAAR